MSESVKKLEIMDHKVNEKETAVPQDEPPKARPNFPIIVKTNRIKPDESQELKADEKAPTAMLEQVATSKSEPDKIKELP